MTRKVVSLLTVFLFLVACGDKNNTTSAPGPTIPITNPGVAPNDQADINTKIGYILNYKACVYSTTRYNTGVRLFNGSVSGVIFNPVINGNFGTVRVASTIKNHVVYSQRNGNTEDIIVSLCDYNPNWGNLVSVEIYEIVPQSSYVSSCNVEQFSALNMDLIFDNGQRVPIVAGPINAASSIPGICDRDFYSESNNGYYPPY
jgi:hypothetical protein